MVSKRWAVWWWCSWVWVVPPQTAWDSAVEMLLFLSTSLDWSAVTITVERTK